jgi:site-specific recombinase XerD
MSVKIRRKGGRLYLDIYTNGTRRWEALHLSLSPDKAQNKEILHLAETCRAKREMQVVAGEWGLLDPVKNKQSLCQYVERLVHERGKRDSMRKCFAYLQKYPDATSIQIGQVTAQWVENFQHFLLKNLKPTSVQVYIAALRLVFNKAVKENIILKSPCTEVATVRAVSAKRVHLDPQEVEQMARTALDGELGAEIRRAFLFACLVGLRISDIKQLQWADIEYNPLQICKRQEKTEEIVYIPLNASAWGLINDGTLHNQTALVFPLIGRARSSRNDLLNKWACAAGVKKRIGWHTARHTFAVQALEGGADLYTVSKLLGHTDIQTTQVYAAATDKMKRAAVEALPRLYLGD